MVTRRPHLASSLSIVSHYQSCASENTWIAIKRVLRYLKRNMELGLMFHQKNSDSFVDGYVDSD